MKVKKMYRKKVYKQLGSTEYDYSDKENYYLIEVSEKELKELWRKENEVQNENT